MITEDKKSLIQTRIEAAELLIGVLEQKIDFRNAIKKFPQHIDDDSLKCAFHALLYYDADDEYREADPEYAQEQNEYLKYIADLLQKGEDIPVNILQEYKNIYENTPLIHKKGIIYTLKNLFRFIS